MKKKQRTNWKEAYAELQRNDGTVLAMIFAELIGCVADAAAIKQAQYDGRHVLAMARQVREAVAELRKDKVRLDTLEKEMKEDPLLLHDCADRSEWPKQLRGLSLLKGKRDLRGAIDCMCGERVRQDHVPDAPVVWTQATQKP